MIVTLHSPGLLETLLFTASAGLILGHNFWLVGGEQRAPAAAALRVEAHVGHHFPIGESAIAPERIADFRLLAPQGATPIDRYRVEGTALVAEISAAGAGTQMAVLTLHPRPITLAAEKFAGYIREEEAEAFVMPAFQPGLTDAAQHEMYSKYAKAILRAQDDEVACRVVGQKMEIVPERSPATLRAGDRLPVRILFDGAPITGVRVSSGCDQLQQGGYVAHARTDVAGRAEIELSSGGHWFVRAHYIRRHPDPQLAEWESFWPSLTFRVDD